LIRHNLKKIKIPTLNKNELFKRDPAEMMKGNGGKEKRVGNKEKVNRLYRDGKEFLFKARHVLSQ
jgi:hypothetical protein